MASMESVSKLIKDGVSGEEIVARVFDGIPFDLFDKFECGYVCSCSRERYLSALRGPRRYRRDEGGRAADRGAVPILRKEVFVLPGRDRLTLITSDGASPNPVRTVGARL